MDFNNNIVHTLSSALVDSFHQYDVTKLLQVSTYNFMQVNNQIQISLTSQFKIGQK